MPFPPPGDTPSTSTSSPFETSSPDDDAFATSGKNSPLDLGSASDDTGNPSTPSQEAAEMPSRTNQDLGNPLGRHRICP
ncbi:hypothetical protein CDV55_105177 [Aspergillus turcosus]|uniref:Uncharacterized protein n=1 Tax=Aspergillus turcosus TaxID=1245748 RepID=A0A229YSI8_9EURO|nr:hypothetical protein CDV55_105177 [Aspergillus turcosus]RLL96477.1 hypothetical protein CFD26_102980 [Aspergillus turcosus]